MYMSVLPYTYKCVNRSTRGIRGRGQAKPVADFYLKITRGEENNFVNDLVFVLQERRNSNAMRLCRAGSQCQSSGCRPPASLKFDPVDFLMLWMRSPMYYL